MADVNSKISDMINNKFVSCYEYDSEVMSMTLKLWVWLWSYEYDSEIMSMTLK